MSNLERANQPPFDDSEQPPRGAGEIPPVTPEQAANYVSTRIGALADRVAALPHEPWTSPSMHGQWRTPTGILNASIEGNEGGDATVSYREPNGMSYGARLFAPGRRGTVIEGPYEFDVTVKDVTAHKTVNTRGTVTPGVYTSLSGEIVDSSNVPVERMPKTTEPMGEKQALQATSQTLDIIEAAVADLEQHQPPSLGS